MFESVKNFFNKLLGNKSSKTEVKKDDTKSSMATESTGKMTSGEQTAAMGSGLGKPNATAVVGKTSGQSKQ